MSLSIVVLPLVALLFGALALLVVAIIAIVTAARRAPDPTGALAARRHGRYVTLAGWAAVLLLVPLLALVGLVQYQETAGRSTALVFLALGPTLAGLVLVGVHLLGERTWPRPAGAVRRAPLTPRTARAVSPGWLLWLTRAWAAGAAVIAVVWSVSALSTEGTLRSDRSAALTALLGAVALIGASELALRVVAGRPMVSAADTEYDAALRTLSAHRMLRGAQLMLAALVVLLLLTVRAAALDDGTTHWPTALGALAVLVTLTALVATFVPAAAPGTPRPQTPPTTAQSPVGDPAGLPR